MKEEEGEKDEAEGEDDEDEQEEYIPERVVSSFKDTRTRRFCNPTRVSNDCKDGGATHIPAHSRDIQGVHWVARAS